MRFLEEEVYDGYDFSLLRELNAVEMCHRRAHILKEAIDNELEKQIPNYTLIKVRSDAIDFWRDIAQGMLKRPGG